ncbi:acetylglutamate kinase [Shimazuella sp. AN120528]|uniref:acetylglutamate kinase n=1 Tax=Shimazuella soli TaxID=1892854 RepID=UPI001F0EB459|nr:acetylglutamate kinase [Shimazuella soli]
MIVIKIGGSVLTDLHPNFFAACAELKNQGYSLVIVHGGGPLVSSWAQKTGKESTFINGYRVTDHEMLTIAEMVLAGTVNKRMVSKLHATGLSAVGLSGVDLQLIQAKQHDPYMGYVGDVTEVNNAVLHTILHLGWVPVIASLGVDRDETHYNINADEAAAAIAQSMNASHLILISDVDGIFIGTGSERKLLTEATPSLIERYIESGEISGGMIPKARSGIKALQKVKEVWIANGSKAFAFDMLHPFEGTCLRQEVSSHVTLS